MAAALISLIAAALLINVAAATNHTVGDAAGWYFNSTSNTTSTNYTAWAANQTFTLGDYLLFNTDMNQTVVQTYNLTTYQNCSVGGSLDGTFQYAGNSTNVTVPLTGEGTQYFFSGAQDGQQCANGMAFEINVQLGQAQGLGRPRHLENVWPLSASEEGQSPPVNGSLKRSGDLCGLVFAVLVLVLFLA